MSRRGASPTFRELVERAVADRHRRVARRRQLEAVRHRRVAEVRRLRSEGLTYLEIAADLDIADSTVGRILRREGCYR